MVNLNSILQNLGYKPNKEVSNISSTAYSIDSFGKRTILANLFINNSKGTFYDKINSINGYAPQLVINLGKAIDFRDAKRYLSSFVILIKPWVSSDDSQQEIDNEIKAIAYRDDLLERIYKRQTFTIMVQSHFNHPLRFGQFYISNFSTEDFITTEEFNDYLRVQSNIEHQYINEAKDAFKHDLSDYNTQKRPPKPIKRRFVSIKERLDNLKQRMFSEKETGYKENVDLTKAKKEFEKWKNETS